MRRLKLLLADDHQLMLEAIRLSLQDASDEFEIVGTTSRGTQVLPLVSQAQPDLVLLDLRMPAMDGLACLEQIRKRHPDVKVVILSGLEDPEIVRTPLRSWGTDRRVRCVCPGEFPSLTLAAPAGLQTSSDRILSWTFAAVSNMIPNIESLRRVGRRVGCTRAAALN